VVKQIYDNYGSIHEEKNTNERGLYGVFRAPILYNMSKHIFVDMLA
jgi:hypothetical protein